MSAAETSAYRIEIAGLTDVGRKRQRNEDDFTVCDLSRGGCGLGPELREHTIGPKGTLLAIADGMGGVPGGADASQLAIRAISEEMLRQAAGIQALSSDAVEQMVEKAIGAAQEKVREQSSQNPEQEGMGTTATVMVVLNGTVVVGFVGDSRAYRLRVSTLLQLTQDQTLGDRLVREGVLRPEDARKDPRHGWLLQAIGGAKQLQIGYSTVDTKAGDVFLLCTDGLYTMVPNEKIQATLLEAASLSQACQTLVGLANEQGGHDNITVLMARLTAPETQPQQAN